MAKKTKKDEIEGLPFKKHKGRVRIVRAMLYKSHMIYVRFLQPDYFEYLLEFNGEVYSGYNIITPRKGKTKLSEKEIQAAALLSWVAGETTLDVLLGHKVLGEDLEEVKRFESGRKSVEKRIKNNDRTSYKSTSTNKSNARHGQI